MIHLHDNGNPNPHPGGLWTSTGRHPDRLFYILESHPCGDRIWELDGYVLRHPDGKEDWSILIECPRCRNHLRLDSTRKAISVTPEGVETGEPIACAWPGEFGACTWTVEFAPARGLVVDSKDAAGRVGKVRLDAVMRRA